MRLPYLVSLALAGCVAGAEPTDRPQDVRGDQQLVQRRGCPVGLLPAVPGTQPEALNRRLTRAPRFMLVAEPHGDLRLFDASSASLVDVASANASDLYASPDAPSTAFFTEWNEDGGGAWVEMAVNGMDRVQEVETAADDVRIIHAPVPSVGLALRDGTTLFEGGQGRAVMGTASFWVDEAEPLFDFWLLERATLGPRLVHYRWASALLEVSDETTSTLPFDCPPRLVRGAPKPLLVGGFGGALVVQESSGLVRHWSANVVASRACVQDALWLSDENVAVVTGPNARVHLLSLDGDGADHLEFAGKLSHDPHPHRRLAYDASRARLWIALSESVEVRCLANGALLPDVDVHGAGERLVAVW